ncbi:MAG TPA: hypothetical protein PKK64_03460 [Saprospiraceae bacterium]|nr:hypothetical protein [Saprospiraceae bacterium]HNN67517.1 hypothetical protein [Saprospiraceae bacterium]
MFQQMQINMAQFKVLTMALVIIFESNCNICKNDHNEVKCHPYKSLIKINTEKDQLVIYDDINIIHFQEGDYELSYWKKSDSSTFKIKFTKGIDGIKFLLN